MYGAKSSSAVSSVESDREYNKAERMCDDNLNRVAKAMRASDEIEGQDGSFNSFFMLVSSDNHAQALTKDAKAFKDESFLDAAYKKLHEDVSTEGFYAAFVKDLHGSKDLDQFKSVWATKLEAAVSQTKISVKTSNGEEKDANLIPAQRFQHIKIERHEKKLVAKDAGVVPTQATTQAQLPVDVAKIKEFLRAAGALVSNPRAFPAGGKGVGAKAVYAARPAFGLQNIVEQNGQNENSGDSGNSYWGVRYGSMAA